VYCNGGVFVSTLVCVVVVVVCIQWGRVCVYPGVCRGGGCFLFNGGVFVSTLVCVAMVVCIAMGACLCFRCFGSFYVDSPSTHSSSCF